MTILTALERRPARPAAAAARFWLALAFWAALGAPSPARADMNPANDAAALTILITPNVERGVVIDSAGVHMDLGTVDMGASTQTVSPATVTITGNVTNTELDLTAAIAGGWVFDNSQALTSTGTNQLNVWATFTSISSASAPSQDDEYFRVGTSSGAKLTATGATFPATEVGLNPGLGFGRFETNEPAADMDGLDPADRRHLWFYFRTPPTSSTAGEQQVQFTLSVRPGQ